MERWNKNALNAENLWTRRTKATGSQRNPRACSQCVSGFPAMLFHESLVTFYERGREKLQAGTGGKSNFTSDSTQVHPMMVFDMQWNVDLIKDI